MQDRVYDCKWITSKIEHMLVCYLKVAFKSLSLWTGKNQE